MEEALSSRSQLLKLPSELRLKVLGYLFHDAVLQVRLVTRTSPGSDSGNKIASKLSGIHCHVAIARSCRVLHHESKQALAQTATVIINAPDESGNQQKNLDYEIALPRALDIYIPQIRHIRVQDHYRPVHLRLGNYTPLRLGIDLSRFNSLLTLTYFYDKDLIKFEEKQVTDHAEVVTLLEGQHDEDEFRNLFQSKSEKLFGPPPFAHFHRWYNEQLADPNRSYRLLREIAYQSPIVQHRNGREIGTIRKKSTLCYDVDSGEVVAKGKEISNHRSECLVGGEWWKETWSFCGAWNRSHGVRKWEAISWHSDRSGPTPDSSYNSSTFQRPV